MTWGRGLLAGALLALLCGCSGPRSGSSAVSAVGGCAAVLPVVQAVVPTSSRLVSVHALRRGDVARYLREVGASPGPSPSASAGDQLEDPPRDLVPGLRPSTTPSASASPREPRGCVVVYRGPFPQGLPQADPGSTGEYALLFADVRHPQVRRVVLTSQLPAGLRH